MHSVSIYQGLLLAEMLKSSPPTVAPLQLDDIIKQLRNGEVRINLQDNQTIFTEHFITNDRQTSQQTAFRDALKVNPPMFKDKTIHFDEQGRHVLTVFSSWLEILNEVNVSYCNYLILPLESQFKYQMAIPLSGNISTRLLTDINNAVLESLAIVNGMIATYEVHATSIYDNCQKDLLGDLKMKAGSPLTSDRMRGTFVLPVMGYIIGTICLVVEYYRSRFYRSLTFTFI